MTTTRRAQTLAGNCERSSATTSGSSSDPSHAAVVARCWSACSGAELRRGCGASWRTLCLLSFCAWLSVAGAVVAQEEDIQWILNAVHQTATEPDAAVGGGGGGGGGPAAPSAAEWDISSSTSWGIPDVSATVGKVFKYELPGEALQADRLLVREAGKEALPSWLAYDQDTHTLSGVPGADETGQQFHIEVSPVSPTAGDDMAANSRDVFTVSVVEDHVTLSAGAAVPLKDVKADTLRPIKCPAGSSVTMATIIVDAEVGELAPRDRVGLLESMCGHLRMPVDVLRVSPLGSRPRYDSSALVAGPGDTAEPAHSGAMVQWEVGCGNVYASHMPILTQLEQTAHDGTMATAVRHGILGWHVTNNKPHAPKRLKRQVFNTALPTPVPTMGPPTDRRPVATRTVGVKETDAPFTRVVPTMASPKFPGEVQPPRTHHTKHHRTKTAGRHHHTKHPHHSPKPDKSKIPMATPTVMTITPTKVGETMPTTMQPSLGRPVPSQPPSSPGLSRTADVIEPSMMPSKPSSSGATDRLPARTYTMPVQVTSAPIMTTETDAFTPPTKVPSQVTPTKRPPASTPPPPIPPPPPISTTTKPYNYEPTVKNPINRLEVTVGDILDYQIPEDLFIDPEEGNTRHLSLLFNTVDQLSMPPDSWVELDPVSQRLYGLPLAQHAGRQQFLIFGIDSHNKMGRHAFEIVVRRRPREPKINHEFSITLDMEYQRFLMDVEERIGISQRIARMYGDEDLSKIMVTRISEGSVVFAWTNKSIPYEPCPTHEIAQLLQYLITPNNTINQSLIDAMKPHVILRAGAEPRGSCRNTVPEITSPGENIGPGHGNVGEVKPEEDGDSSKVEKEPRKTSDEDILITTVVPAVVIAAMLLLAGVIACILYRKKRKGKLSDEDQHTFINKGIPIIFQDELDDKPDPPTKPLIMEEEKPPLPPPEYPRSNPSTPRSDHKEPLIDTTDDDFDEGRGGGAEDGSDQLSPYQPPPPMMGSLHRQQRPRNQTTSRNPPPYVPP